MLQSMATVAKCRWLLVGQADRAQKGMPVSPSTVYTFSVATRTAANIHLLVNNCHQDSSRYSIETLCRFMAELCPLLPPNLQVPNDHYCFDGRRGIGQ